MGDEFLDLDNHGDPGEGKGKGEDKKTDEQLLDGKFKSVDELVKSYKELEGKFTQDSQEKSELKKQLSELQQKVTKTETKEEEPVDLDALFWEKPSAMLTELEKRVAKLLEPLAVNAVEAQKNQLRSDPLFKKFEAEINEMLNALPTEMRSQPNVIGELYNLAKGRHVDEIVEEKLKKLKEELASGHEEVIFGGLEEPTGGEAFTGKGGLPKLSEEEKHVARLFNPELSAEEAYKKYAEKKTKVDEADRKRMRR